MLAIRHLPPSLQSLYQSYLTHRATAARLDESVQEFTGNDVEGFTLALHDALDAVQDRRRAADTFAEALADAHLVADHV